ncbi:MAG TPA: glutamate mutase L, partial [Verrucomicrobiae bacterium]|nr:glutamate mutase L [Verrucomicrobiae bacterium]
MGNVLLMDFGSTYTKITVVDPESETIIATARAHTTVASDIMEGLDEGMGQLPASCRGEFEQKLACSSAAGGLKMVAVGLVKEL